MFINYQKIGLTLRYLLPQYSKEFQELFENLRINQNLWYIRNNSKRLLIKLRKKAKTEKLKVAFVCSEAPKWKCQSLYDLMIEDPHFEPFILSSKRDVSEDIQPKQYIIDTYNFFKSKNAPVKYGYDVHTGKFLHSKYFDADIIFYQQPWNNETTQGPVVASKYALTCYVPYFVATSESWIEYGLRFHRYVQKHYVIDKFIFDDYSKKMINKGKNLIVTGHPQLDYFYLNKKKNFDKKYVIYAPHHSIDAPALNWATFRWSAEFMLEYAKKHPEINWIYKPHPFLKVMLKKTKTMNNEEIDSYWDEWKKIALVHESGDYMDLFQQSYAMITDCGSFLTEYFYTQNPVIHLRRKDSVPFNSSVKKIIENYYPAYNKEELNTLLDEVVIQKKDILMDKRQAAFEEFGFVDIYAAQNILNDLKKTLKIL